MIKKFIFFVGLISLIGCRSEILTINSDPENTQLSQTSSNVEKGFSTSYVSETTLEQNLTNNNLKSILKKSINKIMLKEFSKSQNENFSIYEKVYDSLKQTTTYSLSLIEYSVKNPYYLKNIITVKDGVEKFGFLKIIPKSKPENNKEVLDKFSGLIQILDYNMNVRGETEFVDGIPQNINSNSRNSNASRSICQESFTLYIHLCSNGGDHIPGQTCEKPWVNDSYYEFVSNGVVCTEEQDEYLASIDGPVITGSGGGGATAISKLLNDPKFNYTYFLLGANKMDLLNFVANYVYINDPASTGYYNEVSVTVINQLNQIISVFADKNLFSDFDNLQNLLSNQRFYLQGEGVHYDLRIYNLIKYLFEHPTQENASFVSGATQYFTQNTLPNGTCTVSWTEFLPLLNFANDFLQQNPDTLQPEKIFERINALDNLLTQNPDALLDIPCTQLPFWQDISTHEVPQTVKTKMHNIKNQTNYYNDWELTDLDNGLGSKLNMDLFPVNISTLPLKPNSTTIRYTPAEFFDFFRKNISLFAEQFTPIEDNYYNIHDTALWFSNNPVGALIHIDILPDDGTVACTSYLPYSWIFTTVKAPLSWGYDGVHPVAGNRLFGYDINPNGSINIYTRGVDRVSHNYSDNATVLNLLIQKGSFIGADNLWSGMQTKLQEYIKTHGGVSEVVQPTKYRPDYAKISNYIKGKANISTLGCH